jgi:predicted DNA-binding transcriptional regulator AlpA
LNHRTQKPKAAQPRAVGFASVDIVAYQRARIAEAGGDPAQVPDEPFRFLRLPEVVNRIGLSRSSIYRGISEKTFPAPYVLGASNASAA